MRIFATMFGAKHRADFQKRRVVFVKSSCRVAYYITLSCFSRRTSLFFALFRTKIRHRFCQDFLLCKPSFLLIPPSPKKGANLYFYKLE